MQTLIFLLPLITLLWSATALTVLTYNIQSGSGMDHVYNLTRTADAINAVTPQVDIVTLQEVDNKTKRHPDDQMNILSTLTKLPNVAYAPFRDGFQGGQYGIGILSRFPILDMKIIKYQAPLGASTSLKDNTCAVSHDKDYCQVRTLHMQLILGNTFNNNQTPNTRQFVHWYNSHWTRNRSERIGRVSGERKTIQTFDYNWRF